MLGFLGLLRLRVELHAWRRAGRKPQFWWRDDDARASTPALKRLIEIAEEAGAPLALAVVPDGMDPRLPDAVKQCNSIRVLQHGTDHRNAGPASRPSQFAASAAVETVADDIARGARRLASFEQALPIYVPPWNDLQPNVTQAVLRLGLRGLSAHGQFRSFPGLSRLDIHLDLMRWGGRPRFRGRFGFLQRLVRLLQARRRQGLWSEPIGLLTHHLDHDEPAWIFLRWLLTWPPLRARASWLSIEEAFQLDEGAAGMAR